MKNQFFGDKKDVFKFGICLKLLKDLKINRFTWIAMLTPDDPPTKNYSGFDWVDGKLIEFLSEKRKLQPLDIKEMECFFNKHYKHVEFFLIDEEFKAKKRNDYFRNIEENKLKDALILVDPDTGLEVRTMKRKPDQYLKFDELKCLYNRISNNSILAVFQHQQRGRKFKELFEELREKINKELDKLDPKSKLLAVWSNKAQVMMILVFKDAKLYEHARMCLKAVLSDDIKMESCNDNKVGRI